ncbi:MAG: TraR/DksA C4-type zinc finger protein [Pseudomonadota bacterium]
MSEIYNTPLAPVRHALVQRSEELQKRLGRVENELSSTHSKGFAEQATEREQDEALSGQEQVFVKELAQIKAAIARIDDGTYGQCTACGQDISPRRLEAQPEAPNCMSCAA